MTTKTKGEATVQQIGQQKFNLSLQEMINIQGHCNVLKDFQHLTFDEGLMLQKNVSIIKDYLNNEEPKGTLLDERTASLNKEFGKLQEKNADINKRSFAGEDGSTLKVDREKLNKDLEKNTADREENANKINDYNKKKREVLLNTIPKSSFPQERDKYDKKVIFPNSQNQQEVDRYTSFLELYGTVIPDTSA